MTKFKRILKDEMAGYHTQIQRMRNNDTNALINVKRRKKLV